MTTTQIAANATQSAASKTENIGKQTLAELNQAHKAAPRQARLPAGGPIAPFTSFERKASAGAVKKYGLDAANADRWMGLQRMKLNIYKSVGRMSGDKSLSYVRTLQQQLEGWSENLGYAKNNLATLQSKASGWARVPFSGESSALNKAQEVVRDVRSALQSKSAEADKLLDRSDSTRYLKPVDPQLDEKYHRELHSDMNSGGD